MTAPVKVNLKIYQGSTFSETLRKETSTKVYKPITAIYQQAPMVVVATAHGVPAGWRVKLTNIVGMKEANTTDYIVATETDSDTLTFNSINAIGYSAYISGGIVEYNQPSDLSGVTARMQIREKVTSTTPIIELTTENGLITINDTFKTITISIPATTTETFVFKNAVYSMELISGSIVTPFIYGSVSLDTEITR
jgi:hypothetical protein